MSRAVISGPKGGVARLVRRRATTRPRMLRAQRKERA
jgi:hypothetical protein